jgi:hypothetical protein
MTTTKQRTANRRNARKSTGPKTPEGKAVVALNAMKHGLLSREVLLPDEDEATLVELGKRLRAHLQPMGALEVLFVDRIVTVAWRLRRLLAAETSLFQEYRHDAASGKTVSLGNALRRDHGDRFTKLFRYETTLERALYRALHELQRLQAARAGQSVPAPAILDVDVNVSASTDIEET